MAGKRPFLGPSVDASVRGRPALGPAAPHSGGATARPPAAALVPLVLVLIGAVTSCRKYEEAADFCERDDQCPVSRQCNISAKRCVPGSPDGGGPGGGSAHPGGGAGIGGRSGFAGAGGGSSGGQGGGGTAAGSGGRAGGTGGGDLGAHGGGGGGTGGGDLGAHGGGGGGRAATGGAGGGATSSGSGGSPATADGGVDMTAGCAGKPDCAGTPTTPVCDTATRMCVGCLATGDCGGATPACDVTTKTCVECLDEVACTSAARPFCGAAGACVACAQAPGGAGACAKKDAAHPVCGAAGACVECGADADCHDAANPFCAAATSTCVPCAMAAAGACAKKDAAHPACGATGGCVECAADTDCHDAGKPFCAASGACVGCAQAGASACARRDPAKPACGPTGACVACVSSPDCPSATPVCSGSNTCGPCATDGDCAGRAGPGVCMTHQDSRCATEAETIYVQTIPACSDAAVASTPGGTSATPFCTMQPAIAAIAATAGGTRDLIVVRANVAAASAGFAVPAGKKLSVVGQMSAFIAGGASPAFHLSSGDAYLRDLKLSTGASIGCQADAGSTVRLDHLTVTGNLGGGILLDGAGFEIRDTTVTNNGPATKGAVTWGGIFANNPPAAGPKLLQLVTAQNNLDPGITCTAAIMGTGVLASSNIGGDIVSTCGFTSCGPAAADCGAR